MCTGCKLHTARIAAVKHEATGVRAASRRSRIHGSTVRIRHCLMLVLKRMQTPYRRCATMVVVCSVS